MVSCVNPNKEHSRSGYVKPSHIQNACELNGSSSAPNGLQDSQVVPVSHVLDLWSKGSGSTL